MTRLKFMVLDLSMEFEKILLPSVSIVKEIKIRLKFVLTLRSYLTIFCATFDGCLK